MAFGSVLVQRAKVCQLWSTVFINMHTPRFHMLLNRRTFCSRKSEHFLSVFANHNRLFRPPSLPLSPIVISVTGASLPYFVGTHGSWVARICQPWEQSPSRSWLPIVGASFLMSQAPNLHLVVVNCVSCVSQAS